jgi:hypothetical protein
MRRLRCRIPERAFVRRIVPAIVVTAAVIASLTACSASSANGPSASSCTTPATGSAAESVSATGAIGKEPKVSVPSPLKTKRTEVSVLKQGTGRVLTDGSPAVIEYTVVDGATGKVAQTSGYKGQTSPITVDSKDAGALGKALNCSRVGERLAIVMTTSALSGGSATSRTAKDAAVVIVDVTDGFASRATGTPQIADDGMPAVVLAPSGAPGIQIPSTAAPKNDSYHLLRKGSGPVFTTKDTAVVKYTAVTWGSDASVAGSSWTDGSGAVTVALGSSSQVPAAIRKAVVGHRAGDQVLAIINQSGSTYAYVFDLLGSMPRS